MPTPRRDFLKRLGTTGALAAIGLPASLHAESIQHDVPVSDKWDMTWCDRVTGKVRAVFDSPAISEGAALFRAMVWRSEHQEVYGTPIGDANAVIVFRHEGIPLVMNDSYWERFEIGKEAKIRDQKGKKWSKVNPISSSPPPGPQTPPAFANINLPAFIASGGIVLACNFAFGDAVGRYQKEDKLSAEDARKRAIENLIPGVILQPSGFFAVLRAQQAGCNFILAS